jgi:hypothetical protein
MKFAMPRTAASRACWLDDDGCTQGGVSFAVALLEESLDEELDFDALVADVFAAVTDSLA